jgi:MFS family permease
MLDQAAPVSAIAHLISLAIAPVFLLAGIGSILNVLAGRLARSVDRWRRLEDQYAGLEGEALAEAMRELHILDRRMTVINLAIGCCTGSALFICLVVAILFVADLADFPFGRAIAWLFIAAMLLLVSGLILFLYEVRLAMRSLRAHRDIMPHRRG